jgi:hypothetical protein
MDNTHVRDGSIASFRACFSHFRFSLDFRHIAVSQQGRRWLKARDRRNDGAAFRSPALGHQRRGIAGASTPRIAGASVKIRIFARRATIARPSTAPRTAAGRGPCGSGVYRWAGAARLAYRRRPTQQLRQRGEVHRHGPRLVARQPIWSPSAVRRSDMSGSGRSGSARLALETTLMNPFRTLETKFAVLHKAAFLQRCGRV